MSLNHIKPSNKKAIPKPDRIPTDTTTCKIKKLENKSPCNYPKMRLSIRPHTDSLKPLKIKEKVAKMTTLQNVADQTL